MKRFFFFLTVISCVSIVCGQSAADKVLGTYQVTAPGTNEVSKVKIYKTTSGKYWGKVIWLKEPNFKNGTPKTDIENPDPKLRNTPGDQIVLMKNFSYDSKKNEWNGGTIYNPVSGKTYKCYMKFETATKLKVRGYIGVPALGESMYWYKID